MLPTADDAEALVTTQNGITIRLAVRSIRSQGRNTMGVRVIRLDEGDVVRDAVLLTGSVDGGADEGPETGATGPEGDEGDSADAAPKTG